jgi:beta-lactam-binding protein with PASTA domain
LELQVERQYYSPSVPEGKIMSQAPDAGTKVRRGWQVRVAQSLGPQRVAIPDVTGETSRAAQLNIARRGLDVGAVATVPLANTTPDTVLAQSPPANARQVAAPRISLLVAAAPDPAAYVMPNFVGQPLGSVRDSLQSAGIRLGTVTVADTAQTSTAPSPSPSSLILSQDPAAGQKIAVGVPVNFEVSR